MGKDKINYHREGFLLSIQKLILHDILQSTLRIVEYTGFFSIHKMARHGFTTTTGVLNQPRAICYIAMVAMAHILPYFTY